MEAIKYAMLLIITVLCISVNAQVATQKKLIQDETWIVNSGKSSFRIITSNDSIAHYLRRKFEHNGITKFVYLQKKDRHGYYWERSFYFRNEDRDRVILFIQNGFK